MKNLRLTLGMLAIAAGAISAFAFAPASRNITVKSGDAMLHWFDANTGNYLGQRSESQQQSSCGTQGPTNCARGYSSVQIDENDEIQPVGSTVSLIKKQN